MHVIYLDANASAPALPSATHAMVTALKNTGNPSSPHKFGRVQRTIIDEARAAVAAALRGNDKEIMFHSGASEGNRWLVEAVIQGGARRGIPYKVLTTPLEHPSLLKPLIKANESGQITLKILDINSEGLILLNKQLFNEAEIVFATAAHNETGIIIDWSTIISMIAKNTILIADAAQSLSRIAALPSRIDAIVCSAHKAGGFAGSGATLLRGNARELPAPWVGGGQESGLRPGTESVALIAAFGAAANVIESTRTKHQELVILRDKVEAYLVNQLPAIKIIGAKMPRLPNTSAISIQNVDGEALRIALDSVGVCVGFGSACSALAPEPSFALTKMGLSNAQAKSTIRISLHSDILEVDVWEAIERIVSVVKRMGV